MTVSEAIQDRRATPFYDRSATIERAEIESMIDEATLAPSSGNLQPWEVLLCHSLEDKERLKTVSLNQAKILDASAALVMIGNLDQHLHAERAAASMIERGYLKPERRAEWVADNVHGYADPQMRRDEAFRGTSLFAMTLMLVAESRGWDSAPMGGFDREALMKEFRFPPTHIPIMLVMIGKADPTKTLLPRNFRYKASEILHVGNF